MYLSYELAEKIFPDPLGFKDTELQFYTASANSEDEQPHGLFIPLTCNEEELMNAIHNGAVAAVWNPEKKVPSYTPNHFPIFLSKNMKEDVIKMLELYLETVKQDTNQVTHFLFAEKNLVNQHSNSPEWIEQIMKLTQSINDLRRG